MEDAINNLNRDIHLDMGATKFAASQLATVTGPGAAHRGWGCLYSAQSFLDL